jgi:hypothetical protein
MPSTIGHTVPIRILVPVCCLALTPDRHFGHLLPELFTAHRLRGRGSYRDWLLAAGQTLPNSQDAINNDGIDALLDLPLYHTRQISPWTTP